MLAVSAGTLGVVPSFAHVDSVSAVHREPTPLILLPVDERVATALRPDVEESWLSSTPSGTRRGGPGRRSATTNVDEDVASYRYRRQRNNEAAKRSREKRRRQDGVIRQQLEALAAENRELRCQLALFRRLLDDVAAAVHKDGGGALLRSNWWSLSSVASSVASEQSRHDDVTDESSVDDVAAVGEVRALKDGSRDATGSATSREHRASVELTDDASDWQNELMTPLNLCRRGLSSS